MHQPHTLKQPKSSPTCRLRDAPPKLRPLKRHSNTRRAKALQEMDSQQQHPALQSICKHSPCRYSSTQGTLAERQNCAKLTTIATPPPACRDSEQDLRIDLRQYGDRLRTKILKGIIRRPTPTHHPYTCLPGPQERPSLPCQQAVLG